MTEQERIELMSRMARGEDVCRLECRCAELGVGEQDD